MRCLALFGLLSVLVAQPALATSSPGLSGLEQQLSRLVATTPGEVGIAALDLRDGAMVSVNGETPFPMASTVKLAIAATYLSNVDHGRLSLDDMIYGRSARSLMNLMITRSDNRAADQLLGSVGGPTAVQQWLRGTGVTGIRMDRTIAQLLSARRNLDDLRDSSTPMAMLAFLRKLDGGNLLQPASKAVLLDLMSRCATGTHRIRALLPAGTRVEDKTGTLTGLTADVGYITLPDGHKVALVVFARRGVERQFAIAAAARRIYDGFANRVTTVTAHLLTGDFLGSGETTPTLIARPILAN